MKNHLLRNLQLEYSVTRTAEQAHVDYDLTAYNKIYFSVYIYKTYNTTRLNMKNLGHGHIHGQCIVSDVNKLIFLYIPKNASCSLRQYMTEQRQGYETNYFELEEYQKEYWSFSVIRDPIQRFTSAINTILRDKETNIDDMCDTTLEYHVNTMTDTHLVKQVEFLQNIRIDKYFTMKSINKFFENLPSLNKYIKSDSDDNIIKRVTVDKLQKVYAEDETLYQQINMGI